MSVLSQAINPEALLEALAQQDQPLPEELQQSFRAISQQLRQDQHQNQQQAANQLRHLIEQYPPLETAYMAVLVAQDAQYQAQRQTKSLTLAVNGFSSQNPEDFLIQLLGEFADIRPVARQATVKLKESSVSATQEMAVLKALDKHPLTIEGIAFWANLPLLQAQAVVQALWRKGEIDRLTGSTLHYLFPFLRSKRDRNREINLDIPLYLTAPGYFRLHPLITPSYRSSRA